MEPDSRPRFVTVGVSHEWDPPPWVASFVSAWIRSLENPVTDDDQSLWEEASAVRELKESKYLLFLTSFEAELSRRMFRQIIREIDIYRNLYDCGIAINEDFGQLKRLLELFGRKLRKFKAKAIGAAAIGKDLNAHIRNIIDGLPKAEEEFWRDALDFTESELQHPMFEADAVERGHVKAHYMLPEWVAELEHAAFHWKVPKTFTKRANLDTRLQIRLAVVFRLYLPTVTWRTIARLVALAYICADLALVRNGCLFVPGSKSSLEVVKIEKKIHNSRPSADRDPDEYFSEE